MSTETTPSGEINFCPHCGENLNILRMAMRLMERGREAAAPDYGPAQTTTLLPALLPRRESKRAGRRVLGQNAVLPAHSCPVCGKGFGSNTGLRGHIKRQHPDRAAEFYPYACPQCGRRCANAYGVQVHCNSMKGHQKMSVEEMAALNPVNAS